MGFDLFCYILIITYICTYKIFLTTADFSDFQITELKAKTFTVESELRNKMKNIQKEHEKKVETLSLKIKTLQKEVATLSKTGKKQMLLGGRELGGGGGSGSGTDSPSLAW
jgi:hypothetical protein